MGLDAVVRCRCWQDGLASHPPVPVELDEDGWLGSVTGTDDEEAAVSDWLRSACPHPRGLFAREWIGTGGGMASFNEALTEVSRERYRTLIAELTHRKSGGFTSARAARRVLRELDDLASPAAVLTVVEVVDAESMVLALEWIPGMVMQPQLPQYGSDHLDVWADPAVVSFMRRHEPRLESDDGEFQRWSHADQLLVTSRFRQRRLSEPDEPPLYEITDAEGRTITTPIGFSTGRWIGEEWTEAEPAELLVRARQVPVLNHWRAIVSRLRNIFSASVETGNPVLWC